MVAGVRDAADELRQVARAMRWEWEAKTAQRVRYREALKRIVKYDDPQSIGVRIARQALSGGDEDG